MTRTATEIITSDGTSTLRFRNPATFNETRHIVVNDGPTLIDQLNELEYIKGEIYANIWHSDRIARISPAGRPRHRLDRPHRHPARQPKNQRRIRPQRHRLRRPARPPLRHRQTMAHHLRDQTHPSPFGKKWPQKLKSGLNLHVSNTLHQFRQVGYQQPYTTNRHETLRPGRRPAPRRSRPHPQRRLPQARDATLHRRPEHHSRRRPLPRFRRAARPQQPRPAPQTTATTTAAPAPPSPAPKPPTAATNPTQPTLTRSPTPPPPRAEDSAAPTPLGSSAEPDS